MTLAVPATFMRGGTSKGLMFLTTDLPSDREACDQIFLSAMGSPDPYGRQLNGMGGGISSLSKVCIVGPPSRPDVDVDYTFGQVLVSESAVDYSGNCGNMAAAVGPFSVLSGIVSAPADGTASITIRNTNTGKLIRSHFPMLRGKPVLEGNFEIDGVSGSGAPIKLDFLDPGGSKTGRLLPTGVPSEILEIDGHQVHASLVDAANPCIFVDGCDLGVEEPPSPDLLDRDVALLDRLENLRQQGSIRMGLAVSGKSASQLQGIPKIAMVFAPAGYRAISGKAISAASMDIAVRMISMGKPHRALPITGAICLAVALRIPQSVPAQLTENALSPLRIAHPSGLITVDAELAEGKDGVLEVRFGAVTRTARRLFSGEVYI